MTGHRHSETLFTLLLLPETTVRPTTNDSYTSEGESESESESDDETGGVPVASLDRRLTREPSKPSSPIGKNHRRLTSQPSKPSSPIPLNKWTVNRYLKRICKETTFATFMTETLATGLVGLSAVAFKPNLKQMSEWIDPSYELLTMGKFHYTCDKVSCTFLNSVTDYEPKHGILIGLAFIKTAASLGFICTAGQSILQNGVTGSISKFFKNFGHVMSKIMKLIYGNKQFLAFITMAVFYRVRDTLLWLYQNPCSGYRQHTISLNSRVHMNDFGSCEFGSSLTAYAVRRIVAHRSDKGRSNSQIQRGVLSTSSTIYCAAFDCCCICCYIFRCIDERRYFYCHVNYFCCHKRYSFK